MQNKFIIGIVVVVLIVLLLVLWGFKGTNPSSQVTNIGVILPLSGNGSDQGEWVKQGLQLAAQEINKSNARKINLLFQDDSAGDPKAAVSIYTNLHNHYNIPVIFTWGSSVGVALTSIVNDDKVVQMGVATAANAYSTPNDYTFRNFPSANNEGSYLAPIVLNQLGAHQVAVLKVNNDYGVSSVAAFKNAYTAIGGEVIYEDSFNLGTTDFRTQLSKLKSLNPKFVYLAAYPTEGALLLKQAQELNIRPQFIASVAILGSQKLFTNTGSAIEGLIVVNPLSMEINNSTMPQFFANYEKLYGNPPDPQNIYSVLAYNALKLVGNIINNCPVNDTGCIKDNLYKTDYQGVGQKIAFDENGDVQMAFHLMTVKDGKFVPYNK